KPPKTAFLEPRLVGKYRAVFRERLEQCAHKRLGGEIPRKIQKVLVLRTAVAFFHVQRPLKRNVLIGVHAVPNRDRKIDGLKIEERPRVAKFVHELLHLRIEFRDTVHMRAPHAFLRAAQSPLRYVPEIAITLRNESRNRLPRIRQQPERKFRLRREGFTVAGKRAGVGVSALLAHLDRWFRPAERVTCLRNPLRNLPQEWLDLPTDRHLGKEPVVLSFAGIDELVIDMLDG